MANQSPEYHEGFSNGFHELPCEGARSSEYQAGWLDGDTQVKLVMRAAADRECDCENL